MVLRVEENDVPKGSTIKSPLDEKFNAPAAVTSFEINCMSEAELRTAVLAFPPKLALD